VPVPDKLLAVVGHAQQRSRLFQIKLELHLEEYSTLMKSSNTMAAGLIKSTARVQKLSQPIPRRWPLRKWPPKSRKEPGHTETIEYEDDRGKWHTETASGRDRPHAIIKDKR
jgi:hypothetical protein